MSTGVIPGSGIPSFNMTSAASHSSSPPAFTGATLFILGWFIGSVVLHGLDSKELPSEKADSLEQVEFTSTWLIIVGFIAIAVGYSIRFIILAIGLRLTIGIFNASMRWCKSSTNPPKPVAVLTGIDDTDYTPGQDATPGVLDNTDGIDIILGHITSLEDKVTKDHDQPGEHLMILNDIVQHIAQQQKRLVAFEKYLGDEALKAANDLEDVGQKIFHIMVVTGSGETDVTGLGATRKEEENGGPAVYVKVTVKKQSGDETTSEDKVTIEDDMYTLELERLSVI